MTDKFKYIDLSNLKLDLENPRLPKSKQGIDEKTVIKFMLLDASTTELMLAIGENDFFIGEQLLVVPELDKEGEETGNFIVIEGNRRLTAVKLLNNSDLAEVKTETVKEIVAQADFKPLSIPCLVFDEKQDIMKYLGFRHITGIKSWRLLEKARYLEDLRMEEFSGLPFLQACKEIAKIIGSSSNYIRRLLTSLKLYLRVEDQGFYEIDGLNDTKFPLNYFVDSLNKVHIKSFIGVSTNVDRPLENLNIDNLKTIVHWWFEKTEGQSRIIADSSGLKKLDAVLSKEISLTAFRDKGATIDEAFELTGELDVRFRNEIKKSYRSISKADSYLVRINDFYSELYTDLKAIREVALKIKTFKDQRDNPDDDF